MMLFTSLTLIHYKCHPSKCRKKILFSNKLHYATVVHQSIGTRILWVFEPVQTVCLHYTHAKTKRTVWIINEKCLIVMFIHRHIGNWSETMVSNVIFIINHLSAEKKSKLLLLMVYLHFFNSHCKTTAIQLKCFNSIKTYFLYISNCNQRIFRMNDNILWVTVTEQPNKMYTN